ncbi:MAG: formyltransferase family protein [Phormidesmis sp.]
MKVSLMKVDRSLAVLTRADSKFGQAFLQQLAAKGVKPALICVEYTPFARRWKMAKFLAKKIGWLDAARYNLKFWQVPILRGITGGKAYPYPSFDGQAEKIVRCQNINDAAVASALSDPSIEKIVLAQSGIVRKSILNLGKWIINAHPGKIPRFRGVDVVRWALLQRQPITVTLHLVDAGIDTGYILAEQALVILPSDTPEKVVERSVVRSLDLLIQGAITSPTDFQPTPPVGEGQQYYLMPFRQAQQLEQEWPEILQFYLTQTV